MEILIASVHESIDDSRHVEFLQVWVFLANTNEQNRFASSLHHVDGRANFLIHSVEFGQHDTINGPGVRLVHCEINQRLVKLSQLIDSIVAYQSLTNEQHDVW